jgi:hypothetical protein
MQTIAYFDNIKTNLINELKNANSSILVAVAWFTDNDLLEILCEKANNGINVEIIIANDEINVTSHLHYERINQLGGYFSYDRSSNLNSLMHNKFCVIDLNKTITGSYNWSYKARNNRENITVTIDSQLALQFARYFYKLKLGDFQKSKELTEKECINLATYLKRILDSIQKNNYGKIDSELFILRNLNYIDEKINFITILLSNKQWDEAELSINEYFKLRQQIVQYEDLELNTLQFHKESLENKLDKLLLEKDEIERKIHQFNVEYSQKLGKVLLKLLELKAKHNLNYHGAYGETDDSIKDALKTTITKLSNENQEKIKRIYKKAALLCHPDKVDENMKKEAEGVFKNLNTAYKNNDIEEVNRIYNNLKANNFLAKGKDYNVKDIVQKEINRLIYKINQTNIDINRLKITPSFQVIEKVYDWDLFYKLEEEKINNEIKSLKNEFSKKNFFKKRTKI